MRSMIIATAMLFSQSAMATDFTRPVVGPDGELLCLDNIKASEKCPAGHEATLAYFVKTALGATYPDEATMKGPEKFALGEKRTALIQAITGASGDIKLKLDEMFTIREIIGKAWPPIVVAALWKMLEVDAK